MCSLVNKKSRDSFDRFGDDLCKEILRYLPLSDCFGLQCVNKQFSVLIFNKQTIFTLKRKDQLLLDLINVKNSIIKKLFIIYDNNRWRYFIRNDILNYVLNKCVNISNITIDLCFDELINDETIDIINKCRNITKLTISGSLINLSKFYRLKCYSNLEILTLGLKLSIQIITSIISKASKLKSIKFLNENSFNDQLFHNNETGIINNNFIKTDDNFKHRLILIYLRIDCILNFEVIKQYPIICRIEYIHCDFNDKDEKVCIETLKKISLECKILKILIINRLVAKYFDVFTYGFKSLEKLFIKNSTKKYCENISLLNNCEKLKQLKIDCKVLFAKNFIDIHKYFPLLELFEIKCDFYLNKYDISIFMNHLAKMPNLNEIKIGANCNGHYITDDIILSFIKISLNVKRIRIYYHCTSYEHEVRVHTRFNNRQIMVSKNSIV